MSLQFALLASSKLKTRSIIGKLIKLWQQLGPENPSEARVTRNAPADLLEL